jgi:hypothetical protein
MDGLKGDDMEFENYIAYKYVRLDSDELRFCISKIGGASHKALANGEVAISAGVIGIYPNKFAMIDQGSMSLDMLYSEDSDILLLEKATGRKIK